MDYYLPTGRWTHFLTGETAVGGSWRRETYDFFNLPLWVRPNSVIPVGANEAKPDYDFADGVVFQVFELAQETAVSTPVPNLQGDTAMTLHIKRQGEKVTIEVDGATKSWSVLLRGITAGASISGGTAETTEQGTLLLPTEPTSRLTVQL